MTTEICDGSSFSELKQRPTLELQTLGHMYANVRISAGYKTNALFIFTDLMTV